MITKKTISNWMFLSPETKRLIDFITHESKNVFNHYQYCCRMYNEYKYTVYKNLLKKTCENITETVIDEMNKYYDVRTKYFQQIKMNNDIIYTNINNDNIPIYNYNFDDLLKQYNLVSKYLKGVTYDDDHINVMYFDIIKNILKTRYFRNFYKTKYELTNHIKLTITDERFIQHVKGKVTIFDDENYHTLLIDKYKNANTLKSEQNIIRRFALNCIKDCNLPCDEIINIMDKGYHAYASHMALKKKGLKSGKMQSEKPEYHRKE